MKSRGKILSYRSIVFCMFIFVTITLLGCSVPTECDEISQVYLSDYEDINSINQVMLANEFTEKEDLEQINLEPEYTNVTITAVGDVMMHMPQIRGHYNEETRSHDFSSNFEYITPLLTKSDINIANLETTFGGYELGYSGFPRFNAPDSLANALKNSGFNFVSTINNHTFDTGDLGFFRTLEVLENQTLIPLGTRKTIDDKRYYIEEVNNIFVGVTAYSYETPKFGEQITLNGLPIPDHISLLMNTFNDESIEKSIVEMEDIIVEMKSGGTEVIVFYLHWGNEYQQSASNHQLRLAEKLCELGVDIIFGSHPHVVQPVDVITNGTHETLVVYSMGNFISNQREETLKDYIRKAQHTEDGLMVSVTFEKNSMTEEITRKEVELIPLWVYRYPAEGRFNYKVLPVKEIINDVESYPFISQTTLNRLEESLKRTQDILYNETYISVSDDQEDVDFEVDLFKEDVQKILDNALSKYMIDKNWFGFYIKEHHTGQVFSYNNDLAVEPQIGWEMGKFNAASAVKLPLTYVVVKHLESEGHAMDEPILDKLTGHYFSPQKMISETLIHSTNYSFNYLLRYIGRDRANEYLEEMGVFNSKIITELGGGDASWSLDRMKKDYGSTVNSRFTPDDYGLIINTLYQKYLEDDVGAKFIMEALKNNVHKHRIPQGIDFEYPVAHKTGTFTNAGRFVDMGVVLNPDNPYTLVLILDGQKNHQQCDPFLREISKDINDYMNLRMINIGKSPAS